LKHFRIIFLLIIDLQINKRSRHDMSNFISFYSSRSKRSYNSFSGNYLIFHVLSCIYLIEVVELKIDLWVYSYLIFHVLMQDSMVSSLTMVNPWVVTMKLFFLMYNLIYFLFFNSFCRHSIYLVSMLGFLMRTIISQTMKFLIYVLGEFTG
jgi:hypothetical protein